MWQQGLTMTLQEYLKAKELTPSAFAALIKSPPSTVTRLLKGQRSPRIDLMVKIKVATGGKVTPEDFVSEAAGRAA
jgi:predicted transcriptional regulator